MIDTCYMVEFGFSIDGRAVRAGRTPDYGRERPNVSPAPRHDDDQKARTEVWPLERVPLHALEDLSLSVILAEAIPEAATSLAVRIAVRGDRSGLEAWESASDANSHISANSADFCRPVDQLVVTLRHRRRGPSIVESAPVQLLMRADGSVSHTFDLPAMSADDHDENFFIELAEVAAPPGASRVSGLLGLSREHSRLPLEWKAP